ncbi:kinetochore-associated Ndc80 complex subunit ndc80 [Actinomortierella ambigua]|uniref:Kinetochore protein NDC80 n=1 Tax=Actinomortierella ambigua TaxID=1343610 RepID=A0A9P6QD13_9FUNG|nr:kinetochore-associated Ndc80 complex subunit ndc80 [Actinomortierella ambigua]
MASGGAPGSATSSHSGGGGTMMPPPPSSSQSGGSGGGGPGTGAGISSARWSMSSSMRQSIGIGHPRSSLINAGARPSPMQPLTVDEYGLGGGGNNTRPGDMGPPMGSSRMSHAPRPSSYGTPYGVSSLMRATNVRDPRDIRSKEFQRQLIPQLTQFLTQSGYPHPVSTKTFMNPSTREIQEIFRFMYYRLEPRYEFLRGFEDEVPELLKTMKYPVPETIAKRSLSAVGAPHSWPNILALLGWMMDVILVFEKYKEDIELQALENHQNRDRDVDPRMDMILVTPEKALYFYLTQTYRMWMVHDIREDAEIEAGLAKSFQRRQDYAENEADKWKQMAAGAREELDKIQGESAPLTVLEQDSALLTNEIQTFKRAIDFTEPRIQAAQQDNERVQEDVALKEQELADLDRAKNELRAILQSQKTSRTELEAQLDQQRKLQHRYETEQERIQTVKRELQGVEQQVTQGERRAETMVKEYNTRATRVGAAAANTAAAQGGAGVQQSLSSSYLSIPLEMRLDLEEGTSEREMYSVDLEQVKKALLDLRRQLSDQSHQIQLEIMQSQSKLDQLQETIDDQTSELEVKKARSETLARQYQEEREASRQEIASRQQFIETRASLVREMVPEAKQNRVRAEAMERECEQVEHALTTSRDENRKKMEETMRRLTKFRLEVEQQASILGNMAAAQLAQAQEDERVQYARQQQQQQQHQSQPHEPTRRPGGRTSVI